MSDIARRLIEPARRLSLEALARDWFTLAVAGYGALAHDLDLLRPLRDGIGAVLLEGASPEAIAGAPCLWQPPCALDILFREQGEPLGTAF
jgi:hypothetical protein